MRHLLGLLFLLFMSFGVHAGEVSEAPQEARVRELAALLRCPVCQSENILDSHASTAREMVVILRERIAEGMTDEQIFAFFQSRYGDYVLLSPPSTGAGRIIWIIPVFLIGFGLSVFGWITIQSMRRTSTAKRSQGTGLTEANLKELDL